MGQETERGWNLMRRRLGELSPARKAYALFQLTLPVGPVLAIIGASSGNRACLIIGLVLVGLFLIDTAIVFPILRAREDSKRRRPK